MVAPLARRREISWTIIWRLTFNALDKVPPEMGLLLEDRIFRSCFRLSSPFIFLSPVCWFVMKVICYRVEPLSNTFWDVLMAGNR